MLAASIKNDTAIKENLSIPENILCATTSKGIGEKSDNETTLAEDIAINTGIALSRNTNNRINKTAIIFYHLP